MATLAGLKQLKLNDFSGGLNLEASPSELGPTESPEMMNMILDERGGLRKRLGILKDGSMSAFGADQSNLYYSAVLGQLVVQEGVNVRKRTAAGTFTLVKAFSTAARVTMVDFNAKLYLLHPVDGLFSYDGASVSAAISTVKGVAIASWQNKLWIAQGTAATPGSRLLFSDIGDGTNWTTGGAGSNDIRDVNDEPLAALCVPARGGLIAFKPNSTYRVVDSTNASYVTIDADTGCASAIGVASYEGLVGVVTSTGIYVTDGLTELKEVSRRIFPLFATQLALGSVDKFAATATPTGDFLFSIRRSGQSANDLTLHYRPSAGWIVPHSFGFAAAAHHHGEQLVYHCDPGSARFLYKTFSGGSDNGAAIAARWSSLWLEPEAGTLVRLRRMRVSGFGTFSIGIVRDYAPPPGTAFPFSVTGAGFVWGTGVWGTGVWGPGYYEGYQDFYPRRVCKAAAFTLTESSTLTRTVDAPLSGPAAPEVGAFSLYSILADYQPLGLA